ncbi:hypothetical protein [Mycobacterium sp.]|uniref:hypothetical protein n=1 Tax=Mycobacterium sp. TaxID=1785 RepID=UPI0025DC4223|nr:hypothetical protein [Mycobacterium sp.]
MTDPSDHAGVAEVDAAVAAVAPRLRAPAVRRRDVVAVTGPRLAGVSSVLAALRERASGHTFVESADLAVGEAPTAVVFVVSAAAVITGSDCALLDAAAADTDVVIAVVTKIDLYRNWREVLADDRDELGAHASRYRAVPWVAAAAAPGRARPQVDALLAAVDEHLADPAAARRNRLRSWEHRLQTVAGRYERADRRVPVEALRAQRDDVLRQQRLARSARGTALRSQIQQTRVQLSYLARNRCSALRCELQQDLADLTRRGLREFEPYARSRGDQLLAEIDAGLTTHLADVAQALDLAVDPPPATVPVQPAIGSPPVASRSLETRLMTLLGAGFGLGMTLTLARLWAGLAPGPTPVGIVACLAIGLAVTVWVVSTRGLLAERALLDRWVGEATGSLRSAAEELVAHRVLAAESALSAALNEQDEAHSAQVRAQIRVIDSALREQAAAARTAALRDRELSAVRAALAAVRAELASPQGSQAIGRAPRPCERSDTRPRHDAGKSRDNLC